MPARYAGDRRFDLWTAIRVMTGKHMRPLSSVFAEWGVNAVTSDVLIGCDPMGDCDNRKRYL